MAHWLTVSGILSSHSIAGACVDQRHRTRQPRAGHAGVLPDGLLLCRACSRPMILDSSMSTMPVFRCGTDCQRSALDADQVVTAIGRAVLSRGRLPTGMMQEPDQAVQAAAARADQVLVRVTAGTHPGDLHLTWRAVTGNLADPAGQREPEWLALAQHLTGVDPHRAHAALADNLRTIDPAHAPPHPAHATAARLLAEICLRHGHPTHAIPWAAYAHRSHAHLLGAHAADTLCALHLLATAHRHSGQYQRAHHLYRELADALTKTHPPDALPVLATNANTAVVLHALGHCLAARVLLADTITTQTRSHPNHPISQPMWHHLETMRASCTAKRHHHPPTDTVLTQPQATRINSPANASTTSSKRVGKDEPPPHGRLSPPGCPAVELPPPAQAVTAEGTASTLEPACRSYAGDQGG